MRISLRPPGISPSASRNFDQFERGMDTRPIGGRETQTTLFTPSYRADLERFSLMRRTVRRFMREQVEHVAAVPRGDIALFQDTVRDESVRYVAQEDLVESVFYPRVWHSLAERVLGKRAWRLAEFGGRRGWIIQQIVKLSFPSVVSTPSVIFVDSDLFFIREFGAADLGIQTELEIADSRSERTLGRKVLIRVEPLSESGRQRLFMEHARLALGIQPGSAEHHYLSWPVVWHRDWAIALQRHLESVSSRGWQRALFDLGPAALSEYSLYGVFVEEVLHPADLRVSTERRWHLVWDQTSLESFESGVRMDRTAFAWSCSRIWSNT